MKKIVKNSKLSVEETVLLLSLQGLINRKDSKVFIDTDNYMEYIKGENYIYVSIKDLLEDYYNICKGAVIFTYEQGSISLNIASSISAALDYLMIPKSLLPTLNKYKFKNILDIDELEGDYIDKQNKIFDQYNNLFNKNGLIHQVCLINNYHITLRDYGIANKWFCFYTGEDKKAKAFRNKVLTWANKNIPIYGWTSDEIDFVDDISKYGDYIIPSDWSCNHSFLDKYQKHQLKQKNNFDNVFIDDHSHYLTIVVSDGDNVQWLERDFSTTSSFGQRLNTNQEYIMGWTIAPSMVNSCPKVIEYIYNLGKNNYFVSGVSGAGYMNPCVFPEENLSVFCNETNKLMKKCDLSVVTLLDNLQNSSKIESVIEQYASQDNIMGGIYELDPSKYEGGKGQIFFASNGKPFASVRVSFWSPDGTYETVSTKWIDQIAKEINSFKIDKNSIEGYTVLNVHPWSTKIKDLDYLVSKLDKHVKILRPDVFLTLIKQNIIM